MEEGFLGPDAKVALLTQCVDHNAIMGVRDRLTFDQQCRSTELGLLGEGRDPLLLDWYSVDTFSQLRFLWKEVESLSGTTRKVLTAVFSDILFQCASTAGSVTRSGKKRRHHWGWIADNVRPRVLAEHNAIEMFRERIENLPLSERSKYARRSDINILQQDARTLALADSVVDLIVTSPPYIGMIDYTHANRLL
jgi:hypothetical protein